MTQPIAAFLILLAVLAALPPRYSVGLATLALLALMLAATFEPFWSLPPNSLVRLPDTPDGRVDFGYVNEWVGLLDWVHHTDMALMAIAMGLATSVSFIFPRRRDIGFSGTYIIDVTLQVLWGLGATITGFVIAAWQLRGTDGAAQSHLLLAGGALVLGIGIWVAQRQLRPFATVFAASALALLALSFFYYPRHVTQQAAAIADGAPMCLAVDEQQVQPRAPSNLSLLTIHKAARPYTVDFPAFIQWKAGLVLAVETGLPLRTPRAPEDIALHTWSIWHNGFLSFPLGPRGSDVDERGPGFYYVNCIPNDSFLAFSTPPDVFEATMLNHEIRLPAAYQPMLLVGDISIAANAPEFDPSGETGLSRGDAGLVEFSLGASVDSPAQRVGLIAEEAIDLTDPQTQVADFPDSLDFATRFEDGTIRSAISCRDTRSNECQHVITYAPGGRYDGMLMTIRFSYPRDLLPRWREMEDRLIAMLDDFIVADRIATDD